MDELENISASQRERIRFIDYYAFLLGKIVRKDLLERFGIAVAAATRDFSLYNKIAPRNLIYRPNIRSYVISEQFVPVFEYPVNETLKTLARDLGNISTFAHEEELRLGPAPSIGLIASFTQAIHQNRVVEYEYFSTSSGHSIKTIAPHSLFDTGLRWYVRGYDQTRGRFADFVLSRMLNARVLDETPAKHEMQTEDAAYNHIISLHIGAHGNQQHPETIELDYGMEDGHLIKQVRASFAGYLLRRWNIDCSAEGSLQGHDYQLRLLNVKELAEVENLYLAPGFSG